MSFLDFLKNRNAPPQPPVSKTSQEQKPQSAQEMYTQQAATETAPPTGQLLPAEQTKADRIMATLEKATRHRNGQTPVEAQASASPDDAKLSRAMRFVDTTARPKPETPPEVRWPRPPASWER